MSESSGPFDTHIEIVTPENIAFHYRVAGPFRRLPAYFIDIVLQATAIGAISTVAGLYFGFISLSGVAMAVTLVAFFVISWFYGGVFEALWNGQTPGKRLMQIRVMSADGQPIVPVQAVLRNLLRPADAMPTAFFVVPLYLFGLIACTATRRFQRLGDLAAGTMVVVEEPQRRYGVVRIDEPAALELAASLPPSFEPCRGLVQALSAYVSRRQSFSYGRRMEIARHLAEPLRERFQLPPQTNYDVLLCALYHQVFFGRQTEEGPVIRLPVGVSPFAAPAPTSPV
ncbi:MAG: RDD family protein [Pirellulales bacterium]|nr:RDD family protein [Pirellulales bacterium]